MFYNTSLSPQSATAASQPSQSMRSGTSVPSSAHHGIHSASEYMTSGVGGVSMLPASFSSSPSSFAHGGAQPSAPPGSLASSLLTASSTSAMMNSARRNKSQTSSTSSQHSVCLDMDHGFAAIENSQIFAYFMKHKYCYDIMPKSAKIVIFDTQLLVKKAFYALIYNGVRAAPLWDSKQHKFVGMLTITDFILILQKYYKSVHAKIEELEEHKIDTWREVLKEYRRPFIFLRPDDTLFDAVQVLAKNRVHRLPIIDPITGNVVCIVTHKRILRYLYLFIYDMPQPQFLQQTITDLGVGSFGSVRTIRTSTPITEALNIFVSTRVSALPVVDADDKLVNIYSKFDVIDLAAEKSYTNLEITVVQALEYRSDRFDGVASCTRNETLGAVMERIVKREVHRLVVVDEHMRVTGIVSLSDILTYIVLQQHQLLQQPLQAPASNVQTTKQMTQAFGQTRISTSSIGARPEVTGLDESATTTITTATTTTPAGVAVANATQQVLPTVTLMQPQASTVIASQQPPTLDQSAIFDDDLMDTSEVVK